MATTLNAASSNNTIIASKSSFHQIGRQVTQLQKHVPKYENSYKLESDKPFDVRTVEKIVNEVLAEALEDLEYEPEKVARQAKWASGIIRMRVKAEEYDRYRIICLVSIGEKRSQDLCSAMKFLWDADRDRYVKCVQENSHVFALALCFGIYYE